MKTFVVPNMDHGLTLEMLWHVGACPEACTMVRKNQWDAATAWKLAPAMWCEWMIGVLIGGRGAASYPAGQFIDVDAVTVEYKRIKDRAWTLVKKLDAAQISARQTYWLEYSNRINAIGNREMLTGEHLHEERARAQRDWVQHRVKLGKQIERARSRVYAITDNSLRNMIQFREELTREYDTEPGA